MQPNGEWTLVLDQINQSLSKSIETIVIPPENPGKSNHSPQAVPERSGFQQLQQLLKDSQTRSEAVIQETGETVQAIQEWFHRFNQLQERFQGMVAERAESPEIQPNLK